MAIALQPDDLPATHATAPLGGPPRTRLLCILANPPIGDGARTRARVELAREVLAYETAIVGNLFAMPSRSVTDISKLGATPDGWNAARAELETQLAKCDGVLLAYGASQPTGQARGHHRSQLQWLRDRLAATTVPLYWVGDGPRHPSRWQRWTARVHPKREFRAALAESLVIIPNMPSRYGK